MTREQDAKIAELIFGWQWHESGYNYRGDDGVVVEYKKLMPPNLTHYFHTSEEFERLGGQPPDYTTEASADYLVLEYVRENWSQRKQHVMAVRLVDLWDERSPERESHSLEMTYNPGDYSRAALAVVESEVPR